MDCYIEVTNAPGLSAFNLAERRMYHLSQALTGVILDHEKMGNHLHNGKTIDDEMELKNFQAAGESLAQIWNQLVIDNDEVHAGYVSKPVQESTANFKVTAQYRNDHVIETQYMTVVLKCNDRKCCSAFKTPISCYFPHRRIPALFPIEKTESGPKGLIPHADNHKKLLQFLPITERVLLESSVTPLTISAKYDGKVPYDISFPSLIKKIDKRICQSCKRYHSSVKSLKLHNTLCKIPRKKPLEKNTIIEDDSEEEEEESDEDDDLVYTRPAYSRALTASGIEVILNMREWIKSPWESE